MLRTANLVVVHVHERARRERDDREKSMAYFPVLCCCSCCPRYRVVHPWKLNAILMLREARGRLVVDIFSGMLGSEEKLNRAVYLTVGLLVHASGPNTVYFGVKASCRDVKGCEQRLLRNPPRDPL